LLSFSSENLPLPRLDFSTPASQGPSVSQNAPGIAASLSHNTSLDDFQSPVFRPLVGTAAAALSNESILEFRSPKRRRLMSPEKALSASTSKAVGASADAGGYEDDDDGNVSYFI
jgi:hypothetical protein